MLTLKNGVCPPREDGTGAAVARGPDDDLAHGAGRQGTVQIVGQGDGPEREGRVFGEPALGVLGCGHGDRVRAAGGLEVRDQIGREERRVAGGRDDMRMPPRGRPAHPGKDAAERADKPPRPCPE